MTWNQLFQELAPAFVALLSTLVTVAIGFGAAALQKRSNIVVEQAHRDALHSAIMTGVAASFGRYGGRLSLSPTQISQIVDQVQVYVNRSVPDAMKKFNPPPDVLRDLVLSKLAEFEQKERANAPTNPGVAGPVTIGMRSSAEGNSNFDPITNRSPV